MHGNHSLFLFLPGREMQSPSEQFLAGTEMFHLYQVETKRADRDQKKFGRKYKGEDRKQKQKRANRKQNGVEINIEKNRQKNNKLTDIEKQSR